MNISDSALFSSLSKWVTLIMSLWTLWLLLEHLKQCWINWLSASIIKVKKKFKKIKTLEIWNVFDAVLQKFNKIIQISLMFLDLWAPLYVSYVLTHVQVCVCVRTILAMTHSLPD